MARYQHAKAKTTSDHDSHCKRCEIPIRVTPHIAATMTGHCSFYCQLIAMVDAKTARRLTAVLG